ncbi:MAG: cytochrome C, partial [Bradyrhizobium sp.]
MTVSFAPPAQALPSFARQTGQPCGTCHTDFPALTPYGRRFKLLGYTTGGGEFRTTPFSSQAGKDARAEYEKMLGYVKALPSPSTKDEAEKDYVPPVSMMAIVGYTRTQADLTGTDPYSANNNVVLSPF